MLLDVLLCTAILYVVYATAVWAGEHDAAAAVGITWDEGSRQMKTTTTYVRREAARAAVSREAAPAIENEFLRVRYEPSDSTIRIESKRGPKMSVVARLCDELMRHGVDSVAPTEFRDLIGPAKAFEVRSKDKAIAQGIWTYDGQPFVFTRVTVRNGGAEPMTLKTLAPISYEIDTATPAADLRLFTSDGLKPAGKTLTGYVFMVLADKASRGGVVGGWLTHERGSGVVSIAPGSNGSFKLDPRSEFGRVVVAPQQTLDSETFAFGFFDDIRDGLEKMADATATLNNIKLPPRYSGYSTWYHGKATGSTGALDEKRMAELAKFVKDSRLNEYGLDFLQIDDQWQVHRRDFTAHKPNAPYPSGMKQTADAIKENGLFAGIWLTPFGWQGRDFQDDKPNENKTALKDHPDWFVHKSDGSIYWVRWAGDCLDMSNPQAREFLSGVIKTMTHDWGYKLLKIDGLWSGMACTILYPSPAYRDDHLGDAVFYDKTKSNIEIYRDGLRLIREAGGPDVFLLGCNIAQNMRTMGGSIGLVDSMRVGPDIKAEWPAVVRCAKPASWLYFWNGKVWHNDPDCVMLREPLTIDMARGWASWVALSGQINLVSEWLPALPKERLDIYKRSIPNHGGTARPVDLLDREVAQMWHLPWGEGENRHDVVGMFNWNSPKNVKTGSGALEEPNAPGAKKPAEKPDPDAGKPITFTIDPARVGLPVAKGYIGFDYWKNEFVAPFSGSREVEVPAGACSILVLQPQADHPQLVGTSRHVTQGAVDVLACTWDAAAKTLRGKSKVVAGDDYELRLFAPAGAKLGNVTVASDAKGDGVTATSKQDGQQVRVMVKSPVTREVDWEVQFGS
jgi:hypothetical protein